MQNPWDELGHVSTVKQAMSPLVWQIKSNIPRIDILITFSWQVMFWYIPLYLVLEKLVATYKIIPCNILPVYKRVEFYCYVSMENVSSAFQEINIPATGKKLFFGDDLVYNGFSVSHIASLLFY